MLKSYSPLKGNRLHLARKPPTENMESEIRSAQGAQ